MDEEVQQVQEEPIDAPQDETLTTQEPQEPTEEVVEETSPVEETDDEDDYQPFQVQAPETPLQGIDFSSLPTDEYGNVDANALASAIQNQSQSVLQQAAQMVQQVEERRTEEKLWQKAQDKYPELKTDRQLAEEVNALRFGLFAKDINDGKESRMLTPAQAFERINKRFASQRAAGIKQATESVKVQESAYVEPTNNAAKNAGSDDARLFQQMRSYDKAERETAADTLLKRRLFGG